MSIQHNHYNHHNHHHQHHHQQDILQHNNHASNQIHHHHQLQPQQAQQQQTTKKKRLIDKVCPTKILKIVPESIIYHDMFAFERKLDFNISRKTLDIQEALKRSSATISTKVKKTLRIFISNLFYTHQDTGAPSWELRIEGRLLNDDSRSQKRKFSSFFKSLIIELDNKIYGPDNYLIEWDRTAATYSSNSTSGTFTETDGFQLRRPGDLPVKCIILFQLEHQPRHYKLDKRLARLLGKQTDTRPAIIIALWQYIKNKSLQDSNDREYINNDKYLKSIFECKKMKYSEIPYKLNNLLFPPDPIIINHSIVRGIGETQRSIYEIDVEIDDNSSIKSSTSTSSSAAAAAAGVSSTDQTTMSTFMFSNAHLQELQQLDEKICDTLEVIKLTRNTFDLYTSFAEDPHKFTNKWLASQSLDLKLSNDDQQQHQIGESEEERRADYYYQPWLQEAVCRYFYRKIQERRGDLEVL